MESEKLANMRIVYDREGLAEEDLAADPLSQFTKWLREVTESGLLIEPNAMVLSTIGPDGGPAARSVLLKGADARGLTFFTNYNSDKARDIERNPAVSVVLPWYPLHRQVIAHGKAEKLSVAESTEYFDSRPHSSKLGALASHQSAPLADRHELERRMAELEDQFPEGSPVQMPQSWGGYLIRLHRIEFWQGRQSRLHDRLRYVGEGPLDVPWPVQRFYP